jgi:uncharacterized protein (TIGR03435 family)
MLKVNEGKDKSKEQRADTMAKAKTTDRRPPCTTIAGPGRVSATAMTMATLASSLSGAVDRAVIDRTGATGAFEIELTWTPDRMPHDSGAQLKGKALKIDPNGPSIYAALQEQLGLKLDSTKGSADVLVIDHVEHPTEN